LGESLTPVVVNNDTSVQNTSNKLSPLVFDFGTQFRTGIKSLVFGMSVRNFSTEVKYAQEGFQAPLTFTLGISMNAMDLVGELPFDQALLVSLDASHYRDHPEQVKIGLEYKIMDILINSIPIVFKVRNKIKSAFDCSKPTFHYRQFRKVKKLKLVIGVS